MLLNIVLLVAFFLHSPRLCYGIRDVPFFDDTQPCLDEIVERRDEMSLYEPSLDRTMDVVFSPGEPIPILRQITGTNDQDVQYAPNGDAETSQIRLKKRSVTESDEITKDESAQYEVRFLTPLLREARDKDDVKTIHLPPSFTPRLGRKRSQEVDGDTQQRSHDLNKIMTMERSENKNKINLPASGKFTPRLGRSEDSPRIRFQAGNAFTPRLGRSEDSPRIRFQAGNAFTPRLGRSEDSQRIRFQAGNVFTPRLGRSEDSPRIRFQPGNAFTPRLGRSRDSDFDRVAFTPRQLRSNRINLNAGSAFTPRLGRSDSNKMIVNAGNSFTPRLGRSEDRNKIQLHAGSAFTPRLG